MVPVAGQTGAFYVFVHLEPDDPSLDEAQLGLTRLRDDLALFILRSGLFSGGGCGGSGEECEGGGEQEEERERGSHE